MESEPSGGAPLPQKVPPLVNQPQMMTMQQNYAPPISIAPVRVSNPEAGQEIVYARNCSIGIGMLSGYQWLYNLSD